MSQVTAVVTITTPFCDSCVYCCIDHFYDLCNYFLLSGVIWSSGLIECIVSTITYTNGYNNGCCWLYCSTTTTISSSECSKEQHACYHSGLYQLYHRSSIDEFSFRVEPLSNILCLSYGVSFLLSVPNLVAVYTNEGSTVWDCTATTLLSIPMANICASWYCFFAFTRSAVSSCFSYCCELGIPHIAQTAVIWAFYQYAREYSF